MINDKLLMINKETALDKSIDELLKVSGLYGRNKNKGTR